MTDGKTTMRVLVCFMVIGFLALCPIAGAAPALPASYYGQVTINGSPAPAGTEVSVLIDDNNDNVYTVVDTLVTTSAGLFGGSEGLAPKLSVQGAYETGQTVKFAVNSKLTDQTSTYQPGSSQNIALSITVASPVVTTVRTTIITATPTSSTVVSTTGVTTTSATAQATTVAGTTAATVTTTPSKTAAAGTTAVPEGSGTAAVSPASTVQKNTPQQATPAPAGTPQAAATQSPGFSFETMGLLTVITIGVLFLRKPGNAR